MMLLDILNQVVDIDTDIFLSINRMHSPFFDYFMSAYSGKWIWVPIRYRTLCFCVILKGNKAEEASK